MITDENEQTPTDSLLELFKDLQTPFYVFDPKKAKDVVRKFLSLASRHFPQSKVAYSIKANPLHKLVSEIASQRCWVDVASAYEYKYCREIGIPPSRIIFNSPVKRHNEILIAARDGVGLLVVDSTSELMDIIEIQSKYDVSPNLALRLCLFPEVSRFGISIVELQNELTTLLETTNLRLVGLHFHLGTNLDSELPYIAALKRLKNFLKEIPTPIIYDIEFLDIGGGFPIGKNLSQSAKKWQRFFEAIYKKISSLRDLLPSINTIVLEPGRALAGHTMYAVTRVKTVKQREDHYAITLDISSYHLADLSQDTIPKILPLNNQKRCRAMVKFFGPSCSETDFLLELEMKVPMPGDFLIFESVGAYNLSIASPFIVGIPPVLVLDQEAKTIEETIGPVDLATAYGFKSTHPHTKKVTTQLQSPHLLEI